VKKLIVPFAYKGKKLAFDNFIFKVGEQGSQGSLTESCFYEHSKVLYMLTVECCEQLINGSEESVSFCPHTLVSNYPSIVLHNQLMIVEGSTVGELQTKCQSTTVNQLFPGDLVKLSSCDISVVDHAGSYFLKGSGLLDAQVKLNKILTAEETVGQRDVIFYSVVAVSGLLFLLLIFAGILFCSETTRKKIMNCCCNNCKGSPRYMEPLGNLSPEGTRDYELRALHIRPYVSSMK
jgi:hypothetical protein